ncbi:integrase core domain-containing protein [Nonomuraea sp. NPDC004702]
MNEVLAEGGITRVLTGIRMPRNNSITERWAQSCRHELLDCCLIWNERHLRHTLRDYEHFYNQHRAHQALNQPAPLRSVPDPITGSEPIIELNVRRRDRLGGVLHEHPQAAWPRVPCRRRRGSLRRPRQAPDQRQPAAFHRASGVPAACRRQDLHARASARPRELLQLHSGSVAVTVGGAHFQLAAGDALRIRGDRPRAYSSRGPEPAHFTMVVIHAGARDPRSASLAPG